MTHCRFGANMCDTSQFDLILARMPHAGSMRLIERILHIEEDEISCAASNHLAATYPLRIEGVLYPSVLVEIGAQAAAAHSSIHGIGARHVGLLLGVQEMAIHRLDPNRTEPLHAWAKRLEHAETSAHYSFLVSQADAPVVEGTLLLQMREAR